MTTHYPISSSSYPLLPYTTPFRASLFCRPVVRAVRNAAPRACSLSTGSPFPWPARHQRPRIPPRSEPTDRIASETHAAFLALALSLSASFLPFRFQPSVRHLWAHGLADPPHLLPSFTSSVFAVRLMNHT